MFVSVKRYHEDNFETERNKIYFTFSFHFISSDFMNESLPGISSFCLSSLSLSGCLRSDYDVILDVFVCECESKTQRGDVIKR